MCPFPIPRKPLALTSDDENFKILLDGLQSVSPHALQILAAAAQIASQKLRARHPNKLKANHPNRGAAIKNHASQQRCTSREAVRFDPWTELDTKPGEANAAKPKVLKANSANPKSTACTQAGQSDTSSSAVSAIKAERYLCYQGREKAGVYGRYLQEEDAYISNIHKAILEIVGKHWNDNKYLHRKLLWCCALAPSNSRFALNNIICRTFPAPATSGTIFLWSAFHKIP